MNPTQLKPGLGFRVNLVVTAGIQKLEITYPFDSDKTYDFSATFHCLVAVQVNFSFGRHWTLHFDSQDQIFSTKTLKSVSTCLVSPILKCLP